MIIHRINLPPDNLNLFTRALNYLRLILYFVNETSSKSFDLFVSASIPQVMGSFCVSLLAYLKSTPHIYYAMDIHPESASFSGNYKLFIIEKDTFEKKFNLEEYGANLVNIDGRLTVDTLKWNGLAKKNGLETGDVISEFKIENLNRPNKAIIYPFSFLLIFIFGYNNYRRKQE